METVRMGTVRQVVAGPKGLPGPEIPEPSDFDLGWDLSLVYSDVDISPLNPKKMLLLVIRRCLAAEAEVACLRQQIAGHVDRIAARSELLTQRAEVLVPVGAPDLCPMCVMPAFSCVCDGD